MSDTKFIKTKKERNYTVLDNTFIKDKTLSWKAKGLMTYLLSLPDDWEIHLSEIESHSTDGRRALRSAVDELKEHGYLKAEQQRNGNRFGAMVYIIIENPQQDDSQQAQNVQAQNVKTQNVQLLNTNKNKVLNKQNTKEKPAEPISQENQVISEIIDIYRQNFKNIYKNEPLINYAKNKRFLQILLKKISREDIIKCLDKAIMDKWIVQNGYSFTTILSENQINRLLNTAGTNPTFNKNEIQDFFA